MLPLKWIERRGYVDEEGNKRFADWLDGLDAVAAAKATIAPARMEKGNFSNVKGVGAGVFEYKIEFGPGYRIYFGKDGERLVILIGGGTKRRQNRTSGQPRNAGPITSDVKKRRTIMPLTHDFKKTVRARAQRDPKFRQSLLREAVECILNGDLDIGKAVLRDYVNATVGFQDLEKRTHIPAKSLMRMLGPKGSPSVANFASSLFGVGCGRGTDVLWG